jgi:hypothetical protein
MLSLLKCLHSACSIKKWAAAWNLNSWTKYQCVCQPQENLRKRRGHNMAHNCRGIILKQEAFRQTHILNSLLLIYFLLRGATPLTCCVGWRSSGQGPPLNPWGEPPQQYIFSVQKDWSKRASNVYVRDIVHTANADGKKQTYFPHIVLVRWNMVEMNQIKSEVTKSIRANLQRK